jgi:DNA-binding XRE family transcriptional regulator
MVIDAIKRRGEEGLSLGYTATLVEDEALIGAARRLFGSWDAAVTAAGFDIKEYKYKRLDDSEESWDRDRVLSEIQRYALAGGDLAAGRVRKKYGKLYSASVTHFGSWRAALEALGADYDEIRLRDEWTPEKVIEIIQQAHAKQADLSDGTVASLRGDLYGAAQRHFGSWPAALEAAGLDPGSARRTSVWDKEKIIEFAARAYESGISVRQLIDVRIIDASTVMRYFSGINEVNTAIGASDAPDVPFTSRLADVMQEKGVSTAELASRIGRTDTYVRHLMRAKYLPKLQDAIMIAEALGCDVKDIWIINRSASKTWDSSPFRRNGFGAQRRL